MNFVSKVLGLPKFSNQIGLDRLKNLLFSIQLQRPPFAWVHVAGTKGKGSTSVFLANILKESGQKVGLFLSPHLSNINERISINLSLISDPLESLFQRVDSILREHEISDVSFFEFLTLSAFLYFKEEQVDIAVIETGLGGRFDATTAFENPILSIITTMGRDHLERLGNTIEAITFEKAGILKSYTTTIIAKQIHTVEDILTREAELLHAKVYSLDQHYKINSIYPCNDKEPEVFDLFSEVSGKEYKGLKSNLLGKHQVLNASLAIASSELLTMKNIFVEEEGIRTAVETAFIPGRFEIIHLGKKQEKLVVLDGAHNPESAICLSKTLQERFPGKKIVFLFSSLKGKLLSETLSPFVPMANLFQFTSIPNHATYNKEEFVLALTALEYCGPVGYIKEPIEALEKIMTDLTSIDLLCVTGSLYLVGLIRDYFHVTSDRNFFREGE